MVVQVAPTAVQVAQHKITLQALGVSHRSQQPNLPKLENSKQPLILERTDQDFIAAILSELSSTSGILALKGRLQKLDTLKPKTFYQPVHRVSYVALQEVVCDYFENHAFQPRLDPQKIHSAGLVVRRITLNKTNGKEIREGWQRLGNQAQGWMSLKGTDYDEKRDPDPAFRYNHVKQNADNNGIALKLTDLAESYSPMFVAPPAICKTAGRTILYGLVPVTSSEFSGAVPQSLVIEDEDKRSNIDDVISEALPKFLKTGGPRTTSKANETLNASDADDSDEEWRDFIANLQKINSHYSIFDNTPESQALFKDLNLIELTFQDTENQDSKPQKVGDFLKLAAKVFLYRETNLSITMPEEWPKISADQEYKIVSSIRALYMAKLSQLNQGEGRFDTQGRQYRIRAFVRIKQPEGCPPKIIWGDYSERFVIAPWYESGPNPPVKVVLPNVLNPKTLTGLKPDVAFAVPPQLFDFLNQNKPEDLLKGQGGKGNDSGLEWICSFNIPIITLCAFIVLNIFLQLFNLIFWWLPFVKICIPFPKDLFSPPPPPDSP